MPLGVSEGLLQKAYGPIDFSGFYKHIDDFAKQAYAETQAEKKQLAKEFYTTQASINKDVDKIRSEDSAEIMGNVSKWKSANQKLMINPNLIKTNPKLYGELKNESDSSYNKIVELSNASKSKKAEHVKVDTYMRQHPEEFEDGAHEKWLMSTQVPTSKLFETNADDYEQHRVVGPKPQELFKDLQSVSKSAKTKANYVTFEDKNKGYRVGYEHEIPSPTEALTGYTNLIGSWKNPEKASTSILGKVKDYDQVVSDFNTKIKNEDLAHYKNNNDEDLFPEHTSPITGKMTRMPDLDFNSPYASVRLASYYTAKNMMDINTPKEGKQFSYFAGGELQKKKEISEIAFGFAKDLEKIRNQHALERQTHGAELQTKVLSKDKLMDAKVKLLMNLVGTEQKQKLTEFYENLDFDNINKLLDSVINIGKENQDGNKEQPKKEEPKKDSGKLKLVSPLKK